jgi:two-component system phosphate regulon sensor histidine kinase PhoR
MQKGRLFWQLFPTYLLMTIVAVVIMGWFAARSIENFHLQQTAEDLESRGRLLQAWALDRLKTPDPGIPAVRILEGARLSKTRLTLISPDGTVIVDSEENPALMENHAERPEIARALRGTRGRSIRFSYTLKTEMMYVALPMKAEGKILGVLRTSRPLTALGAAVREPLLHLLITGVVVVVLAALLSLLISRRVSRPLEEMRRGAESFAGGDFSQRLYVSGSAEVLSLADSMNRMAEELDERIRSMTLQRNEQEAILASMVEGVVAVGTDDKLLRLNQAAADMLDVEIKESQGRSIWEVVRNTDLQAFIQEAANAEKPIEARITVRSRLERHLQAHGVVLRDAEGHGMGALVVLNDITRLKSLEDMRRQFVANVSHELKTPITSIKGFVETLQDGAIENSQDAEKFLKVVRRQADRLNAIIEDLLVLSRLDRDEHRRDLEVSTVPVGAVIQGAVGVCRHAADEKGVSIRIGDGTDLGLTANAALVEQALVNLLDNAIKYSEAGQSVEVEVTEENGEISISVVDQGCGIPREHLPRIFERFYRVDKARSRKLGGTGLGLAIVKHIAQAHGGRVAVESEPGKGSTFRLILPSGKA